ncbi:uncharacterized protein LOC131194856 [Ahaetulla prasina]|uniref:uncharacterized protein LOC131194856 n=1 Tax=Ahaetulla prasina TaxID=499056 RepID=UPI00264898C6|nr:uncharacterized protein LOC131194856 [Ahaetulla prasina]
MGDWRFPSAERRFWKAAWLRNSLGTWRVRRTAPDELPTVQIGEPSATGPEYNPSGLESPRIFHQHDQEPLGTDDSHPRPGSHNRCLNQHSIPLSGTSGQFAVTGQVSHVRETCLPEVTIVAPREDGLLHRDCPMGTPPLQGPLRLGSAPRDRVSPGQVDSSAPILQHQLVRAKGHTFRVAGVSGQGSGSGHSNPDRQHGRQGPCQPPRGHLLPPPDAGSGELGPLGGEKSEIHKGHAHIRGGKCQGRQAQPSHHGPRGVASSPGPVQGDIELVRHSTGRSICHSDKHSDNEVLQQVSVPRVGRRGCSTHPVASRPFIRLSTPSIDSQGSQETDRRADTNHLDSASLASSALVCRLLSVQTPWRIPPHRVVLIQGSLTHPLASWLQLTAWRLSGAF